MTEEKKYKVIFRLNEGPAEVEVFAMSEADAVQKAKIKLSIDRDADNYQVIPGASALLD